MVKYFVFPVIAAGLAIGMGAALADHPCDPVAETGWKIVPSRETVEQSDGAPHQDRANGNWFVDRTTVELPLCNYFNEIGIYSMRSYSLSPESRKERVAICRRTSTGGSEPVPPYAGSCPPK